MGDTAKRWTTQEMMSFVADWNLGTDIGEMAQKYDVSPTTIRKRVLRLRQDGVPLPHRRAGHIAGRYNDPWTQADVEYVVRRRKEGISNAAIAVELGRTFCAVQGIVSQLRKEGVVEKLGSGRKRLWNFDAIKAAAVMDNLIQFPRQKKKLPPLDNELRPSSVGSR